LDVSAVDVNFAQTLELSSINGQINTGRYI